MKRRTRLSIVILGIVLVLGTVSWSVLRRPAAPLACSVGPAAFPVSKIAGQNPATGLHVSPPDTPYQRLPDCGGRKPVPNSWGRHEFNGGEFYVIPLARNE